MSTPLTRAHIAAEAELRRLVKQATIAIWRGLPGYDRADVETFVDAITPIISAAQRQSVALTEGYLARALERPALGLDPAALSGAAVRNGATPAEVYSRPFVNVWTALGNGVPYEAAVAAGLARATATAAMDVQLSARATFDAAAAADDNIYGYQRVADGDACKFCSLVDGAYVKRADAMALHDNCGCSLEPLTSPHPRAAKLPSGVAVHEHGELGAVFGSPDHNFTGPSGLA